MTKAFILVIASGVIGGFLYLYWVADPKHPERLDKFSKRFLS